MAATSEMRPDPLILPQRRRNLFRRPTLPSLMRGPSVSHYLHCGPYRRVWSTERAVLFYRSSTTQHVNCHELTTWYRRRELRPPVDVVAYSPQRWFNRGHESRAATG